MFERIKILGLPVDIVTVADVITHIENTINSGNFCHVITANSLMYNTALSDEKLYNIIKSSPLIIPDSIGILVASWLYNKPLPQRITGIDLVDIIAQFAVKNNYSLYLLGSEEKNISRAIESMKKKFGNIKIVGYHHGSFSWIRCPATGILD